MPHLTYKALQLVTYTQDPFRGTMNFPMYSDRRQPYSLFQVVETENDIEYHVCYGKDWDTKEITEEKYNLLKDVKGRRVTKKDRDYEPYPFYERITMPRALAIVRSDNTIEFTLPSYWQGDRKKMSDWIKPSCYMFDSYRYSGNGLMVYGQNSMPIFRGLRLDAETLKPHESQNIQVFRRTVDRKRSKPLMERYKTKLDVAHAMLKCLDADTMMVSARDLYEQHADKSDSNYTYLNSDKAMKIGDDLLDSGAEFEASLMFAMAIGVNGFSDYALKIGGHTYYNVCEPKNIVPRLKASLAKKAYETHKPFYEVEVPFMNTKGSEWGLRVTLNGVDVVR
jgi:hypothetical protein